jgi:hypothetical protein
MPVQEYFFVTMAGAEEIRKWLLVAQVHQNNNV